jgi:DNA-binding FadR family transcriptional regulator
MAELVASELRGRIIRGELGEDDSLRSESELTAMFGVSRPTLREAFRILEAESLISIRRGARGGARVHPPRPKMAARYVGLMLQYQKTTLGDVSDVRVLLEAPCAAALARRRSTDDVLRMRSVLEVAQHGSDVDQVGAHNDFHTLIVELTGNQSLILLSQVVQEIVNTATVSKARRDSGTVELNRANRTALKTHLLLVDLIEAGDAEAAETLWRRHLTESAAYTLGKDGGSAPLDVL